MDREEFHLKMLLSAQKQTQLLEDIKENTVALASRGDVKCLKEDHRELRTLLVRVAIVVSTIAAVLGGGATALGVMG